MAFYVPAVFSGSRRRVKQVRSLCGTAAVCNEPWSFDIMSVTEQLGRPARVQMPNPRKKGI